jgi:hypothetical protein
MYTRRFRRRGFPGDGGARGGNDFNCAQESTAVSFSDSSLGILA